MVPRTDVLLSLTLAVVLAACTNSTTAPSGVEPSADRAAPSRTARPAPGVVAPAWVPPSDDTTVEESAPVAVAPNPSGGFALTMDRTDSYLGALRALAAMGEKNPALDDLTSMNASSEDAAQYAARLRRNPEAVATITAAGLTPEEYAQTGEALIVGMMTASALESGALKKIPDGVDPQFVAFAQQNKAALAEKLGGH